MTTSAEELSEWSTAVTRELGLEGTLDADPTAETIDELAARVAGGVDTGGVPLTAFLIGVAAGRAEEPAVAARDFAEKIAHLADGWHSTEQRGEPAGDQAARA